MPYVGQWKPDEGGCKYCGEEGTIQYIEWESSCGGYEDFKYRCINCEKTWWIDGADG